MKKNRLMPKNFKLSFLTEEKGSISVIVCLALSAFLTLTALVADMGAVYQVGANLQTAADAAVMAAGILLPIESSDSATKHKITTEVNKYINKNSEHEIKDINIFYDTASNSKHKKVGVTLTSVVPMSFAKIIGVNEITVSKTAEAKITACTTLSDVIPLSVNETDLLNCISLGQREHIMLKLPAGAGENGAFGAIDLDGVKGGGANDYANWLENGFQGELTVGEKLYPVESGNMAGPTYKALTDRYSKCTHYSSEGGCNINNYYPYCDRVVKVPIVTSVSTKYVQIDGFAAFVLENTSQYKKDSYVTGSYVDMVNIGSYRGDLTDSIPDYGVYSVMLSK